MATIRLNDSVLMPGWVLRTPRSVVQRRNRTYYRFKRLFDIAVVMMAAPIVLPLCLLVALAIRIDSPGPILFAQKRTGKNGRRFYIYKFRTMVRNAEELKAQLAHLNELKWPDFKITNDPRITRVGRFLRRTSLDELPQLLNVLKGDMSLVGPRPTSFSSDTYQLWHTARLDVTPGLTGLWQITGRGSINFDERLKLDIAYIERQGMLFDLMVLVMTVVVVLKGKGK